MDHDPARFRQTETQQIFDWIRAGESVSVIGVSGVGKSNLFNHLFEPRILEQFLGDEAAKTLFLRINLHGALDYSERGIYSLILEQAEQLTACPSLAEDVLERVSHEHEALFESGSDMLKMQYHFRKALNALMTGGKRLVLFLDQFDSVFQEARPRLFASLRGLREAYRYRLSFIIFTRDCLPDLFILNIPSDGKKINNPRLDPDWQEFYELFQANLLWLRPYTAQDASLLIQRIADRYGRQADDSARKFIFDITGGHGGLLRAVYLALQPAQGSPSTGSTMEEFLGVGGLRLECEKLFYSLSLDEQMLLFHRSGRIKTPSRSVNDAEVRLRNKGLLGEDSAIFSPLFTRYIELFPTPPGSGIEINKATREVQVFDLPGFQLSTTDYRMFELLYMNMNQLVEHATMLEEVWGDHDLSVANILTYKDSIRNSIKRIRGLMGHTYGKLIENIHDAGYILWENLNKHHKVK